VSPKHDAVESIRLPTAILGFPVKGFPNAIPLRWGCFGIALVMNVDILSANLFVSLDIR